MVARAAAIKTHSGYSIHDLRDFLRDLRKVEGDYSKRVKEANYELAQSLVTRAKARARTAGIPTSRRVAQSLRAARSARESVVSGGGARVPTFWGAEFGAKRYRQFKPWRGNQWGGWSGGPGYFLHPTIRDNAESFLEQYIDTLAEIYGEAFPH